MQTLCQYEPIRILIGFFCSGIRSVAGMVSYSLRGVTLFGLIFSVAGMDPKKMAGYTSDPACRLNKVLKYGSEYTPALKVVFYPDLLNTSAVKPGSTIFAGPAFRNNKSI